MYLVTINLGTVIGIIINMFEMAKHNQLTYH
jgi:hypothetical protein